MVEGAKPDFNESGQHIQIALLLPATGGPLPYFVKKAARTIISSIVRL
jgi:hypothetical protein